MIFLSDPEGRVMIDQGMLMVVGGGMLGAAIGVLARSQYLRMKRGQRIACLAMMTFLGACVAAPIGWLSGNVGAKTSYELKKRSADRMGWGIALGSGIGLFLGLPEVLIRRRGAV
ncbi:MAG TPA: hypothetical protein VN641_02950 [Urbifossiella sp.]|nr:hypothetical protein [Urbifossiella sp.]